MTSAIYIRYALTLKLDLLLIVPTLVSSTLGSVAGAGGHRGRLEDDGVAAGGEPNRHLLVEDPPWSLNKGQGKNLCCFFRLSPLGILL